MRKLLALLAALLAAVTGADASTADPVREWQVRPSADGQILRQRVILPAWVMKERFPTLIVIRWKLEGDMPSRAELKRTRAFEDALSAPVEAARVGVLTTVVTGAGEIWWQYYAASEDAFKHVVAPVLRGHDDYPVTVGVRDDPSWSAYAALK